MKEITENDKIFYEGKRRKISEVETDHIHLVDGTVIWKNEIISIGGLFFSKYSRKKQLNSIDKNLEKIDKVLENLEKMFLNAPRKTIEKNNKLIITGTRSGLYLAINQNNKKN